MPQVVSCFVEVSVFRFRADRPEYLLMKRSGSERVYPNLWQFVTGKVREGESGIKAALRELHEETGFVPVHFWVVPFVSTFFEPVGDTVSLIPAFACQVRPDEDPVLSAEHDQFEWLPQDSALCRLVWPGQKRILENVHRSIVGGEAAGLLTRVNL